MLIVTIVSRDLPLMTETSTRQNCFARGASTKSSSNKVLVASWMQSCHLLRHHRQARRHKCRPVRNTSMSARTNLRFASHGMLLYASLDLHPCRLGIGVWEDIKISVSSGCWWSVGKESEFPHGTWAWYRHPEPNNRVQHTFEHMSSASFNLEWRIKCVVALHHALTSDSVTGNCQLKLSTSLKLSIPRGHRPTQLGGIRVASSSPFLLRYCFYSSLCSSPTEAAREPWPTLPPLKLATAKILCQLIDLGSALYLSYLLQFRRLPCMAFFLRLSRSF